MMPNLKNFETWYEATVQRGEPRPILSGIRQTEVCVIGAGLSGLTCALQLAKAGKSVVLLEGKRIAHGASGRNGGFVSNGFAEGVFGIVSRTGLDAAKKIYRLSALGTDYVRSHVNQLDQSALIGEGTIVARRYRNREEIKRDADFMRREFSETFNVLETEQTRELLNTSSYYEALYNPNTFHIHPLKYAIALAREAEANGASIFENTWAASIKREGASWLIFSKEGKVEAEHVVHCTSALDRALNPRLGSAILPVATYVAATNGMKQDVIRTTSAIADTRRAGDYYRLIPEGRIMWGGRITTRISEPARLATLLRRDMLSVYPQLGDLKIDFAWSGVMGYAVHKMPLIGRDQQGQWYATAFGGHGLNTTAMAGCLIADAIAKQDDSYRRFSVFSPVWAGGPLGRIGVQTSYWWMQLRDKLEERRSVN